MLAKFKCPKSKLSNAGARADVSKKKNEINRLQLATVSLITLSLCRSLQLQNASLIGEGRNLNVPADETFFSGFQEDSKCFLSSKMHAQFLMDINSGESDENGAAQKKREQLLPRGSKMHEKKKLKTKTFFKTRTEIKLKFSSFLISFLLRLETVLFRFAGIFIFHFQIPCLNASPRKKPL